jgi:hypothetical protein
METRVGVHVVVDDAACRSATGQLLLLSLVNQLARVHRKIGLDLAIPEAPLRTRSVFTGSNLADTALSGLREIDPFGSFGLSSQAPSSAMTLGIGPSAPEGLDWYLGAEGAIAALDKSPLQLKVDLPGSARGAGLASCLGAAAIFRCANSLPVVPRTLSAWNYSEGELGDSGPNELRPVDVGRVMIVGAGAVSSSLVYWLYVLGVAGVWRVIDKDIVKLHNTNRSLLFLPSHAGWGGGKIANKAEIAARYLPNSEHEVAWYHDATLACSPVDVILALANEYGVRTSISSLSFPLVLHATTGENWITQLHRHIAGRDDCIRCRTADIKDVRFGCSEGIVSGLNSVEIGQGALPFLSAAAGLMLFTALERLAAGELQQGVLNDWRWYWDSEHRMSQDGIRSCRAECRQIQPLAVRKAMHGDTRWIQLEHKGS